MLCEFLNEFGEICEVKFPLRCPAEESPKGIVFGPQLRNNRFQFLDLIGRRENHFFFSRKVDRDFTFEVLLNLCLPAFQVDFARVYGPVQAHAKRQHALVLVRQWNQIAIAKHRYPL
jgi:hypothetical protein